MLGIREASNRPAVQDLAEGIGDRSVLLMVDNYDHLMAAGPSLVELLTSCPRLTMLVTAASGSGSVASRRIQFSRWHLTRSLLADVEPA